MENNIFPQKELYIMEHSKDGRLNRMNNIPQRKRRKVIYENMHLMEGMTFTSHNQFPQLDPYIGNVDFEAIPYTERRKHNGANQALHFFLDDYRFRDAIWYNLEHTTYSIRDFQYLFTPDLSLWVDLPTDFCNKENLYRTRFVGAYWQKCGYNVIPTASWGNMDSFKYCFEGLPDNSVMAVSGMGHHHCTSAKKLWFYALRELERQKSPILILIYGKEEDIPGLTTPIKFIPCFISKRLRNEK